MSESEGPSVQHGLKVLYSDILVRRVLTYVRHSVIRGCLAQCRKVLTVKQYINEATKARRMELYWLQAEGYYNAYKCGPLVAHAEKSSVVGVGTNIYCRCVLRARLAVSDPTQNTHSVCM
jgi:hypothetical protein